jgi:hypothetical protein
MLTKFKANKTIYIIDLINLSFTKESYYIINILPIEKPYP